MKVFFYWIEVSVEYTTMIDIVLLFNVNKYRIMLDIWKRYLDEIPSPGKTYFHKNDRMSFLLFITSKNDTYV